MDAKTEKFLDEHPDCILLCPPREKDRAVAAGWPEDRMIVTANVDSAFLISRELLNDPMVLFPPSEIN